MTTHETTTKPAPGVPKADHDIRHLFTIIEQEIDRVIVARNTIVKDLQRLGMICELASPIYQLDADDGEILYLADIHFHAPDAFEIEVWLSYDNYRVVYLQDGETIATTVLLDRTST